MPNEVSGVVRHAETFRQTLTTPSAPVGRVHPSSRGGDTFCPYCRETIQMPREANAIISKKLREAREQTDQLLEMVRPEAFYDRPIAERHRLVFYAGHLDAFDWNMICRRELGLTSFHPEFDQLFEFGIDPGPDDLPTDKASDWPSLAHIDQYRVRTREA